MSQKNIFYQVFKQNKKLQNINLKFRISKIKMNEFIK